MNKFINVVTTHLPRITKLLLTVAGLVLFTGCGIFGTKSRIEVPQLLQPLSQANKDRLFQEINRLSNPKSLHGKIDIQFEDTSFAAEGVADKYRQVDGTLIVQRPGQIYLAIQFISVDLIQMASDGEHFRVAVLRGEERYKRFVKGTNSAVYPRLETDAQLTTGNGKKAEKQTVSALSNLRPQHLTDALMIRPIEIANNHIYAQSEYFQEEPDTRPRAKKNARIMRGYYLLDELSLTNNEARVLRRFWFDRVNGVRLARVQTYDNHGLLVTDVSYFNERTFGESAAASLPGRIVITRPQDQYKLSISYQEPTAVQLNKQWSSEVFVLENKWQLPEVDLDAQNKKVTANH